MTPRLQTMTVIFLALLAAEAVGQQCPSILDVTESVRGGVENWEAVDAQRTRLLAGLEIVEGEPGPIPLKVIRPFEDGRELFAWDLGYIGTRAVWMRCVYQHTELRLVRRVDTNASKCRVTRSRPFARSGEWIYAASCS